MTLKKWPENLLGYLGITLINKRLCMLFIQEDQVVEEIEIHKIYCEFSAYRVLFLAPLFRKVLALLCLLNIY